ncbi:flagellin [Rhizobium deserti]|uniref:Flagellin n=1 Tax=Rhizobium deserti TaxID=2547961 RepID=A0A4R5UMM3_9HYPH|nr:flagellin [Rhizobium deserti]TDK38964.1 flagellin [Rhizobium deserti]
MSSIITNFAANTALQTLREVHDELEKSQNQVSSGLRVRTASDNVAYWSISTTMNSDKKAVSATIDALGVGAAKVDTAYAGMAAAIDVMSEFKSKLVTSHETSTDKTQINNELDQLKEQLKAIAKSASFSGENWLWMTDPADAAQNGVKKLPSAIIRDASGNVSVQTINFDMTATFDTDQVFYLISNGGCDGIITNSAFANMAGYPDGPSGGWVVFNGEDHPGHPEMVLTQDTTAEEIEGMTKTTDLMIQRMIEVAAMFGSLQQRIGMQTDFASKLSDSISSGVSRLVDTDMEEASAKLSALQTQQQLAIQSLAIANANPKNIMTLFQ